MLEQYYNYLLAFLLLCMMCLILIIYRRYENYSNEYFFVRDRYYDKPLINIKLSDDTNFTNKINNPLVNSANLCWEGKLPTNNNYKCDYNNSLHNLCVCKHNPTKIYSSRSRDIYGDMFECDTNNPLKRKCVSIGKVVPNEKLYSIDY